MIDLSQTSIMFLQARFAEKPTAISARNLLVAMIRQREAGKMTDADRRILENAISTNQLLAATAVQLALDEIHGVNLLDGR
jgi:hypothetical protein